MSSNPAKFLAEFLGTFLIVCTVVGAGHMATQLEADPTIGLVMISLAVGFVLFVAISMLLPISGAHFNPAVTIVLALKNRMDSKVAVTFIVMQILGAFAGAVAANLMFEKAAVGQGVVERIGAGSFLGEVIATGGLMLLILLLVQFEKLAVIPAAVGAWVAAGHFFTSSTSFSNPAVTFGRSFSDGITGIHTGSVPGFVAAQFIGAAVAFLLFVLLTRKQKTNV